jgi:hypothetical protein
MQDLILNEYDRLPLILQRDICSLCLVSFRAKRGILRLRSLTLRFLALLEMTVLAETSLQY